MFIENATKLFRCDEPGARTVTTPIDAEIRLRVAAVLAGDAALRDFYRWFMPATWDIDLIDNPDAVRMIHEITHLFSEFSSGDLSRGEMLRELEGATSLQDSTTPRRSA